VPHCCSTLNGKAANVLWFAAQQTLPSKNYSLCWPSSNLHQRWFSPSSYCPIQFLPTAKHSM